MGKKAVSDAQKKAVAKYERENYDKVLVRLPKGTKERISKTGAKSFNSYVSGCVLASLEQSEDARAADLVKEKEEKEAREKEENTAL